MQVLKIKTKTKQVQNLADPLRCDWKIKYIIYISGDMYDTSIIIHLAVIISRAVTTYGSHEMRFIAYYEYLYYLTR